MDGMCLAILKTSCGDWHFYDLAALQVVSTAYAITCSSVSKCEETEPSRDEQGPSGTSITAGLNSETIVEAIPRLLDGFSIEAWAAYGKLKAKVATKVCKEKGCLKSRTESMSQATAHGTSTFSLDERSMMSRGVDPVFQNDPWPHVGSGGESCSSFTQVACDRSSESAWSTWRGVQGQCTGSLQLQCVAPWHWEDDCSMFRRALQH